MLFLPILYTMLFVAGARPAHLLVAALIGIAMLPVMWQQMSREQKSRVVMVFNQKDGGVAPTGDGFHLHQSKQVFALGGLWGSIAHDEPIIDDPSAYLLPAARTDFILSIIGRALRGCRRGRSAAVVWSDCGARTGDRETNKGAVRPACGGGHCDDDCDSGSDQRQHDCRTDANHRDHFAHVQLWWVQPAFDVSRDGPADEHLHAPRLRSCRPGLTLIDQRNDAHDQRQQKHSRQSFENGRRFEQERSSKDS